MFYDGDDRQMFENAVRFGVEQMNIDHVEVLQGSRKRGTVACRVTSTVNLNLCVCINSLETLFVSCVNYF